MELTVYLTFSGEGEAAIENYSQIFDGKVNALTRYKEAPFETPVDYKDKIMFAELELQGIKLLISDIAPGRYGLRHGNQVALMLNFESFWLDRGLNEFKAGATVSVWAKLTGRWSALVRNGHHFDGNLGVKRRKSGQPARPQA